MIAAFHEEWFCEQSQGMLAELAKSVADIPGLIVEVGSWEGRSTCALANAVYPHAVHAVDTWQGSPGEVSADLAAKRDVFAQFRANIEHHTRWNVTTFQMGWRTYLPWAASGVVFLFIDAEHTYAEVRDTIAAFRPLMVPGSIMCGDDAGYPPVRDAVLEAFGDDALTQATLWWVDL